MLVASMSKKFAELSHYIKPHYNYLDVHQLHNLETLRAVFVHALLVEEKRQQTSSHQIEVLFVGHVKENHQCSVVHPLLL